MKTKVQGPDGGYITVEHPEGASDADIIAYAKENYAPTPVKIGKEGFDDAAKQVAGETGAGGRYLQGVGETFDRYAYGLKGLFTDLSPEERDRLEQNKALTKEGGTAGTLGQISGDLAITGPVMARAPVAVARYAPKVLTSALARAGTGIAEAIPGAGLVGRTAAAAAPGAAAGALSSPEDRSAGALTGAAGGLLGAGVNRVAGGVLKPFIGREGQELIEQGVQPTPGQAMGGVVNRLEQMATSMPIVGDMIARGRNRAIGEFNQALAGRVSQEIGGAAGAPRAAGRALGETGDEALINLRRQIGDVYENVLGQVPKLRIEPEQIARRVAELANDPGLDLSEASAQRLMAYAEKHLLAPRSSIAGEITGETAKRIESDMGKAAANARASSVGEERAYGQALDALHETWRDSFMGSLPQEAQAALAGANRAWRAFRPIDEAAAAAGSQLREGVFTPRVLRSALARGDKSQSDNVLRAIHEQPVAATQSPYGYVASMSRAGHALGDTVGDSGTAGRWLMGMGALGGLLNPTTALGVAGPMLAKAAPFLAAYTRPGSHFLTQGVLPKAARKGLEDALARQGLPPDVIQTLVQRAGELAGRTVARPGG